MTKERTNTITGRIRTALAVNPDADAHQIAAKVGCTAQRVREMRWRIADPERFRRQCERYSRSLGCRPIEEWRAEWAKRSAETAKRQAKAMLARRRARDKAKDIRTDVVLRLRAKGLSFMDCARELRTTKGAIAGIVFRAQHEQGVA